MDGTQLPPQAPEKIVESRWRRWRRSVASLAGLVAAMVAIRASVADHVRVPTGSMQPTVEVGDRVFVNKAAYGVRLPMTQVWLQRFGGPSVGDVVVLDSPDEDKVLLKRVVAGPGDTIEVRGGRITLNGVAQRVERLPGGALRETLGGVRHALRLDHGGGPDYGPATLPALCDCYLVLGDNRGDSRDGRFFGLVDRDAILGRAALVFMRHGKPVWNDL